ncbi:hypothetical protein OH687_07480 [Burkholderia anthina]|nr:hypothetical protein OH687_07480 [Burkholderia anthina]
MQRGRRASLENSDQGGCGGVASSADGDAAVPGGGRARGPPRVLLD